MCPALRRIPRRGYDRSHRCHSQEGNLSQGLANQTCTSAWELLLLGDMSSTAVSVKLTGLHFCRAAFSLLIPTMAPAATEFSWTKSQPSHKNQNIFPLTQQILLYATQFLGLLGQFLIQSGAYPWCFLTLSKGTAHFCSELLWFNLSQQLSPSQLLSHSPVGGWGWGKSWTKGKKLVGGDEDSLAGNTRAAHTSKAERRKHSPLAMGRLVSRRAGLHHSL